MALDAAFAQEAINLMCSFYLSSAVVEVPQLPAVATKKPVDQRYPFTARFVDLKLRRNIDTHVQNQAERIASVLQMVEEAGKGCEEVADLTEMFLPAPAARPDTPKHVVIEQKVKEEEAAEKRTVRPPHETNRREMDRQFQERLKKSEEAGQSRAQKRYSIMTGQKVR
jgi:hypothetical protein